jgi:transcription elongation factor GreA
MQKIPMTKTGFDAIKEELHKLKAVKRPQIVEAIAEARAHGDLSENAEYHAAKEQQGLNEARIKYLGGRIPLVQVIDVTTLPNQGKVVFGTTVTIINADTEKEVTYQLVGEDEADIKALKVSIASPIARSLIGKEVGDEVVVKAPGGDVEYEVVKIQFI